MKSRSWFGGTKFFETNSKKKKWGVHIMTLTWSFIYEIVSPKKEKKEEKRTK